MKKKTPLIAALLSAATVSAMALIASTQAHATPITVYKSETCNCCQKWVGHLREHDFDVKVINTEDMRSVKRKFAVPGNMMSCHTAITGDYVIEGHVPAQDIHSLIQKQLVTRGLAVPGMPAGSPGMEMGSHKQSYQVFSLTGHGPSVYANH